jgi:hypothetical protein
MERASFSLGRQTPARRRTLIPSTPLRGTSARLLPFKSSSLAFKLSVVTRFGGGREVSLQDTVQRAGSVHLAERLCSFVPLNP